MVTYDRRVSDATEIVVPRPAATVVLLRPGVAGLEALLVERPATMSFAPGLHAFPGGAIDEGDREPELAESSTWRPDELARAFGDELEPADALATAVAAIRELFEETGILLADSVTRPDGLAGAREALLAGTTTIGPVASFLGIRLRTDLLAPLSRWVTPAPYPRRFDARFYAAELPRGAEPLFAPAEVASHRWLTPRAALDALADGSLQFWPPTSTTLQQLEHVRSFDVLLERLTPGVSVERWTESVADGVGRVPLAAGGGVPGQPVNAYLIGHRELVLVDPGDPGEAAALALDEAVAGRRGTIRAIVLTHGDPDHAAGALGAAERWGAPVFVGPGGGRDLPFVTTELHDGDLLDRVDLPVTALLTPGHRPDHVALVVDGRDGRAIVAGDLVGQAASRTVVGRPDPAGWRGSLFRIAEVAPDVLLPGHGEPVHGPEAVAAAISEAARRAGSGAG
jgi:glyoxylase-like metal-dependent hydrolase (beta-lactamase superfamily II)/8-oxo-dGTP pyrophosphatase MutT (NUDIX family)